MKLKKTLLITGKIDDFMIVFSMKKARDGTWEFFNQIHKAQQEDWNHFIPSRDQKVAKIIYFINPSGLISKIVLGIIRIGEKRAAIEQIEVVG